jgi:hypothetical protein
MVKQISRALGVALAILVLAATNAAAQTTGRISGTVVDGSGGAMPGVTVTVTQQGTGFSRATVTDQSGAFVLVSLPRGTYDVTAELAGFKRGVKTGFELVADGRVTADFVLEVGQVQEVIEVTVAGETVNTVSGEIARVVDREQVQNLALNGRNYMQLATLIPGAVQVELNALDIMTGLSINTPINGSRGNANLLMVDGGFNMDSGSNNSQISNVGIDFIEEVSIKTANFSAEYGRNSGASINVVTRGGSNDFHGSLYEYHRNEGLDSNDYFGELRDIDKAPLKYNNFGYSLGGPIQKNKLFFFAGQEWKIIRRFTSSALRTLPTRAMRNGDFSGIATVIRDPVTGLPFPGNRIPADRITADGRAIGNVYTAMEGLARSYTDTATSNNSVFQGDNPFDFRQDMLRLDYQASDDHRLSARILLDDYDLDAPYGTFIDSDLPTIPTNRKRPGRNIQLSHNWTVASNLINEFRANASWNSQRIPPIGDAWKRDTYGFTFPQIYLDGGRFENSIPDVTISGFTGFEGADESLISPTTDFQFTNNLSWLKGAHTIKTGAMVIRNRKDQNGRTQYAGQVNFNPAGNSRSTGHAFADALLGNFRSYTEAQSDPIGFFRFWQIEGFVSDNWRVSRNLSFEVGLRYAWHQPIYTQANNMSSFDPALYNPARAVTVNRNGTLVPGSGDLYNGIIRAGEGIPEDELFRVPGGNSPAVLAVPAGAPRGFYDAQHLIQPRFSFAWTPQTQSQMAVRGGIGLFYDRPEGNLYFGAPALVGGPPYSLSANYENGNLSAPGGGTVPALAPLGEIGAINPDLKVPRSWNWSASVQRELPWGLFGEIAYVGSKGQQLLSYPNINNPSFEALVANAALPAAQRANTNFLRPFKGFSNIRYRLSDGESDYHAMQLFLSRRKGALRWTLSYSLGRARDNGSGNGDNLEAFDDVAFNYGPSGSDRTHIVVGTWTYQLPIFKAQKGVGRVLGGWEFSGIGRYQSGEPLTVTGPSTIGGRRADFVGGDPYVADPIAADGSVTWLNRAAFAAAPENRRGNSSRGQFRGPDYLVFDLSLRKQFAIAGDVKMQIQADLFNALNRDNFRNPNVDLNAAAFGTITTVAPPRQIQLGARLTF